MSMAPETSSYYLKVRIKFIWQPPHTENIARLEIMFAISLAIGLMCYRARRGLSK